MIFGHISLRNQVIQYHIGEHSESNIYFVRPKPVVFSVMNRNIFKPTFIGGNLCIQVRYTLTLDELRNYLKLIYFSNMSVMYGFMG